MSVDGILGSEAEFFVRRLGDFLATKSERPYSVVMGWLLCMRGSQTKWRSLGISDGASLPIIAID